jgi:hypothetical protein
MGLCLGGMEPISNAPAAAPPLTRFSADGLWWWSGAEWKPAISPDRLWRWNGHDWEPAAPAGKGSGVGVAVGLTMALFFGVLVLVSIVTVVILLTLGGQFTNVLSNLTAALNGQ